MSSSPSWSGPQKDKESNSRSRRHQQSDSRDARGKLQRYVSLQEIKAAEASKQAPLGIALDVNRQKAEEHEHNSLQHLAHRPSMLSGNNHSNVLGLNMRLFATSTGDSLESNKFEESVEMNEATDVERGVLDSRQGLTLPEGDQLCNVSGGFRPQPKLDKEQQTDVKMRALRDQKENFDNLVRNFDFIREVVRKYMRLDISCGYKHAYDQRQKEKIN